MCKDKKYSSCVQCEYCDRFDAEFVIDPYDSDVNNRETWVWLCEECYNNRKDDI